MTKNNPTKTIPARKKIHGHASALSRRRSARTSRTRSSRTSSCVSSESRMDSMIRSSAKTSADVSTTSCTLSTQESKRAPMESTSGSTSTPTSPSPSSASTRDAIRLTWRRIILHAERVASQAIGMETLDASIVGSHRSLAEIRVATILDLHSVLLGDANHRRKVGSSAQV